MTSITDSDDDTLIFIICHSDDADVADAGRRYHFICQTQLTSPAGHSNHE